MGLPVGSLPQGASVTARWTPRASETDTRDCLQVLTKSHRAMPDKFHGLVDVEKRYRQRYVDLIANPEVKETFRARSIIVSTLRRFLEDQGFLEIETPVRRPLLPKHCTPAPLPQWVGLYRVRGFTALVRPCLTVGLTSAIASCHTYVHLGNA